MKMKWKKADKGISIINLKNKDYTIPPRSTQIMVESNDGGGGDGERNARENRAIKQNKNRIVIFAIYDCLYICFSV